jgi:hypothetical protein
MRINYRLLPGPKPGRGDYIQVLCARGEGQERRGKEEGMWSYGDV